MIAQTVTRSTCSLEFSKLCDSFIQKYLVSEIKNMSSAQEEQSPSHRLHHHYMMMQTCSHARHVD